ncbi:ABC-type nitrate/sulfonate/bicarbonate transport system permease component [Rathayibacter sp. PhB93]|uniref:ABC transporter permease n=2 Tax=unclassified Rathayibacter TaxID=2609250 RepID=UPI000F4A5F89|nr:MULTISPECIES: ABC transporter permease subunit [unclassified Rathayibacter]ROQ16987.1 ABC-type nitrate/sulfonate/bicarbonate transport system permease component [Rathayibacter sp. PhB93]TDQ06797.1 ABC-type nitrate/sulfonate/bicarbonate transport system permease component [Rathayibacter sp. PhB1]
MTALAPPEQPSTRTSAVLIRRRPRGVVGRVVPILGLIALWWLVALVAAPLRVVPTPWAVVGAFVDDLSVLPMNVGATLANAGIGYVVGNAVAVLAAILFVQVPWTERVLLRIAVMSFCVPLVAITPILVVVFPGDMPKQILAGLSVLFTTLVSCLLGLRSVNGATVDLVRSMGGSDRVVLRKARLTAMLPGLFAGLQIAAPAAILGTILGEYLGASRGLGVMLVQAQSSFQVPRTWAVALTMSALAGLVYFAAGLIGRAATPWVSRDVSTAVGQSIATASGLRGGRSAVTALLGLLGSIAVVVAVWWGAILAFDLSPYFAKTPLDVLTHLFADPDAAENRGLILDGLAITLRDAGVGYVIGTALACLVAVGIVLSRWVERTVLPAAVVMRSIPLVAMTPLLALVFGRGLLGVTVIVSLVTFFPTLVSVAAALRAAPVLACDLVVSMGGSTAMVTRKVRLLYALPAIFASARIAVPGAFAGATLAEWLATGEGLGSMLVRDYAASRFSALWSETVVVVAVAVALYALVSIVERPVVRHFATGQG